MFLASYVVMWILLLVLSVLVLLLYRHFGLMGMDTLEGIQRDGLPIGEEAPRITAVSASGAHVVLVPGEQRPTFLLFASPDCEPCRKVAVHVNELQQAIDRTGLDIAVIAAGQESTAARMAETFKASFQTLADNGSGVFDAYRVRVTPFAFVVGEDRRVRAKGLCGDAHRLHDLLLAAGLQRDAGLIKDRFRPAYSGERVAQHEEVTA